MLTPGSEGMKGAITKAKELDREIIDVIITVSNEDAYRWVRETASTEGILMEISSGAAAHTALELTKRPEYEGKTIVALLPMRGNVTCPQECSVSF